MEKNGLTATQVHARLAQEGLNVLPSKPASSILKRLIVQMHDPIFYVLFAAAFLKLYMRSYTDALAIFAVVLMNGILGFFHHQKAEKALKALEKLLSPSAKVLRDNQVTLVEAKYVVREDILVLESGMRIAADAIVISQHGLFVDESLLTGEAFPVIKKEGEIVFAGSMVTRGRAQAETLAIGANTEIGKIQQSLLEQKENLSPLEERMNKFGKKLTIGLVAVIGFVFVLGMLRGFSILDLFMISVSLAVSAIPEALPLAVTICLSIGVHQMAKRRAVVKNLSSVETLGSTNVICTDKTGTLTQNKMKVMESGAHDHQMLVHAAFLASETVLEQDRIIGDPIEGALMLWAKQQGFDERGWQVHVLLPFESETKLMAVSAKKDGQHYIFFKGALEEIQKRLQDQQDVASVSASLKVLGFAYKKVDKELSLEETLAMHDLLFAGILGLQDPPRDSVKQAIANCYRAQIKVVMITGDHAETAKGIARHIGLGERVCNGAELENKSLEDLATIVMETDIFARVMPLDKVKIVEALQKNNLIVAMTGDGVNDAPALQKADIGVAMGSGTDVAKDASDIVILDDDFSIIAAAVERGRVIFDNLQQMLQYLLTTAASGVLTIFFAVLFGLPLPLLPLQLLWINLVTDGSSTIPLAMEEKHDDVLDYPPRPKEESLVNKAMLIQTALLGIYMAMLTLAMFHFMPANSLAEKRTIAFCMLAVLQIANVHNARSLRHAILFAKKGKKLSFFSNPVLLWTTLGMLLLQYLAAQVSFFSSFLHTVPLDATTWGVILVGAFSIVVVADWLKYKLQ